jgi:hypothetical protein
MGYVAQLVAHAKWEAIYDAPSVHIVHMAPSAIIAHTTYQAWMRRFTDVQVHSWRAHHLALHVGVLLQYWSTFFVEQQHIIVSEQCAERALFHASELQQVELNRILPNVFPLSRPTWIAESGQEFEPRFTDTNVVIADSLMRIHLHPPAVRGSVDNQDTLASFTAPQDWQASTSTTTHDEQDDPLDPTITFLGTGAAIPSKYRNGMYHHHRRHQQHDNKCLTTKDTSFQYRC